MFRKNLSYESGGVIANWGQITTNNTKFFENNSYDSGGSVANFGQMKKD